MRIHPADKKSLLMLLVKRAVLFLLILAMTAMFLYIIGNIQDFVDNIQINLLSLTTIFSLLCSIGAFYGFFLDMFFTFKLKRLGLIFGAVSYLLVSLLGISMTLFSSFITILTKGNI